jgi:alkanesulfonate monooxygenase SsuD/methylene tetrahydromethanopterin reductase-like flavin-dependent oxidoreductase (luciferase family)
MADPRSRYGPLPNRRPLAVGLILPHWTDSLAGQTPRWADMVAVARAAEAAGFDSLWVFDTFLWRVGGMEGPALGVWEGWSLLGALAASTASIALGTLVTSSLLRHPALVAKMAETVDEISGGRLILGLGAGDAADSGAVGLPVDHRFDRFAEALTVIRGLLRTGRSDFQGTYYQIPAAELRPRGPRPGGGPPLLIGTAVPPGPRMLRLVAQYAELWNGVTFELGTPEAIAPLRATLDAACASAGRDPATLALTMTGGVALPGHRLHIGPLDLTDVAMRGSPEELAATLRAFARAGVSHLQLVLAPSTAQGVEAFAPVLDLLDGG